LEKYLYPEYPKRGMAENGFKSLSVPEDTLEKLEEIRKARGERSMAAVVVQLADRAHARIDKQAPNTGAI
jgi:hypothetical protein